ncbi:MAG: MBL fold metallo-hydrolase [Clostridia bacterium]|nr:MBL fold metallo-hydrolase [Clostridia bacterium]
MEKKDAVRVTVFGTRGSVPVSGPGTERFGGRTSCYLVSAADAALVIDAGTGIMNVPEGAFPPGPVAVFLTHAHADHVAGLPFFRPMTERGRRVDIYAVPRGGLSCREMLDRYFSPPVWPVRLSDYPADVRFCDLTLPVRVGPFCVDGIESRHPGGSTVFGVEYGGRRIVIATDFEHGGESDRRLADFARGADLLMYDGQYADEEYEKKRGYGHSTPSAGLALAAECGARRLYVVHHDPDRRDDELERIEAGLCGGARLAREGDVIEI